MNTEARSNAKSLSNAIASCIASAGEIFADGAMLELVSGASGRNKPDVLLWNGRKATLGPRVKHGGYVYEATALPAGLYRATRLPSHCGDYVSARGLFDATAGLFRHHFDLPEREANLLACFAICSWLADCLPIAPSLVISGCDEGLGIDLLRLLSCVCRHPLILAGLSLGSFRSMPLQLPLTLLLNQQELTRKLERLLRSSSYRGLHFPGSRGSVVDRFGPKAILCGNDVAVDYLGGGVIDISVPPSQLQPSILDEQTLTEIANDFQPRLLMYRLKNSGKVNQSQVDVSQFTYATRPLARTLAMCFPEDLELAREIVQLLGPQDADARLQRANSIECAIVEVLLGFLHEQKLTEMTVGDLADLANGLLVSRGEILAYGAEQVGWKVRGLNLARHRTSSGSQIQFDRQTSHQIHRLARAYGLGLARIETCSECAVM